jgi:very-short-patch-repair endonuclease
MSDDDQCTTSHISQTVPVCDDEREAVRRVHDSYRALCESEAERRFFDAMWEWNPEKAVRFKPQVWVCGYRLDFADEERMINVEIDGHDYHSSQEAQERDRVRDRTLRENGWFVVRYTGSEIYEDAYRIGPTVVDAEIEEPGAEDRRMLALWQGLIASTRRTP